MDVFHNHLSAFSADGTPHRSGTLGNTKEMARRPSPQETSIKRSNTCRGSDLEAQRKGEEREVGQAGEISVISLWSEDSEEFRLWCEVS